MSNNKTILDELEKISSMTVGNKIFITCSFCGNKLLVGLDKSIVYGNYYFYKIESFVGECDVCHKTVFK